MWMLRRLGALVLLLAACGTPPPDPPNLIYILADDLGYGELGSYGQTRIRTPNLDRLAAEGMRFTQHYSGSPVCAPSRASLLTGLHTGHAEIRDNDEMAARGDVWNDPDLEGQRPLSDSARTLGELLQDVGYVTALVGKWGLGWVGSEGDPNRQGFDHFYGYICQRVAHNYYPTHLWRDGTKHMLDNERFSSHQRLPDDADPMLASSYDAYRGNDYAMDQLTDDALDFVRENRDERFFLYLAYPVPHLALQVPDEDLREYAGAFEETPYRGDRGYLPHPTPRAAYAAMITRMDSDIGRLMTLLADLDLDEDTLVVFASDNGPSWVGGVDREFFESSGGLKGRKAQLYEGGIRVPMIARWPQHVPPGSVSDHVSAFWDVLPTFAELAGAPIPAGIDGLSMVPTLLGRPDEQAAHEYLYWEHARSQQAVRHGDWKAYRPRPGDPIELYDLSTDSAEQNDVAAQHPDVVAWLTTLLSDARTPSEHFPLKSP